VNSREFQYHLPEAAIAKYPISPRRASRLAVVHPEKGVMHETFEDLPSHLGDARVDGLWANDTQVLHARAE